MAPASTSGGTARAVAGTLAAALLAAALLAACGTTTTTSPTAGSSKAMGSVSGTGNGAMADMAASVPGHGLLTSSGGFTLRPLTTTVTAGRPSTYAFRVVSADGRVVTSYQPEQTKLLHLYLIRSDITGFEHLHPTLGPGGAWSVIVAPRTAGSYRVFTQFNADRAGKVTSLVLSQPLTVTGPGAADKPLPPPSPTTTADGYTLTVSGHPAAGSGSQLTVAVARNGRPVTDLQPYLDTYAHLTALHRGDLGFAHLHPTGTVDGDHGGPTLSFHADFAQSGPYRVFMQFQTAGVLHTAVITVDVR